MANHCYFEMRVKGTKANCEEFFQAMKGEGKYSGDKWENQGVGRVFDVDLINEGNTESDGYYFLSGDCAWSIETAMRNPNNPNNIAELSEHLELTIEAFSQEEGLQFMEYFCIENGEVTKDEVEDWVSIYFEDWVTEDNMGEQWDENILPNGSLAEELGRRYGITRENFIDHMNEDSLEAGGFPFAYITVV